MSWPEIYHKKHAHTLTKIQTLTLPVYVNFTHSSLFLESLLCSVTWVTTALGEETKAGGDFSFWLLAATEVLQTSLMSQQQRLLASTLHMKSVTSSLSAENRKLRALMITLKRWHLHSSEPLWLQKKSCEGLEGLRKKLEKTERAGHCPECIHTNVRPRWKENPWQQVCHWERKENGNFLLCLSSMLFPVRMETCLF